jgi:hypothetical protein
VIYKRNSLKGQQDSEEVKLTVTNSELEASLTAAGTAAERSEMMPPPVPDARCYPDPLFR